MKVKRFVVFAYETYYPGGGWNDYQSSFDTAVEAYLWAARNRADQIIDLETGRDIINDYRDR